MFALGIYEVLVLAEVYQQKSFLLFWVGGVVMTMTVMTKSMKVVER